MDNNQEFDLEDILREFGSEAPEKKPDPGSEPEKPQADAPQEPELTFAPKQEAGEEEPSPSSPPRKQPRTIRLRKPHPTRTPTLSRP